MVDAYEQGTNWENIRDSSVIVDILVDDSGDMFYE